MTYPRDEVLHCAGCGAIISLGQRFCGLCGWAQVAVPPPLPEMWAEGTPLPAERVTVGPCPRCKVPLAQHAIGRAELDVCRSCGGVFVSAVSLARLLFTGQHYDAVALEAAFAAVVPRPVPVRIAWCPSCGAPMMDRALVAGASPRASVCRAHGAWLDAANVTAAMRVIAMRLVGRAGDLERAAFADDVRCRRFAALVVQARGMRGAVPRSPLGLLATLFG